MLNDRKISIVVQGPVFARTKDCLKSLRKFLPNSQIILSTWEYSDLDGLEYDNLVLSECPKENWDMFIPGNKENWSKPNNINKQIISTQAGLSLAEREYTLKWRTDFILSSIQFLYDYFEIIKLVPQMSPEWKLFTQRILTVGTGNIDKMGLSYHLSDYIAFGLTSDIQDLWNIPLIDDQYANYGYYNKIDEFHQFNFMYAAEQKLLLDNLDKNNIEYHKPKNYFDKSSNIKEDSEKVLINNFIFYDYPKSRILSKFSWMNKKDDGFSYSFLDFINLYDKYVEPLSKQTKNQLLQFCYNNRKKVYLLNIKKYDEVVKTTYNFYFFGLKIFSKTLDYENGRVIYKLLFFKFKKKYNRNFVKISYNNSKIKKLKNKIKGFNNRITIRENVNISNLDIKIFGNNNSIIIDKNCSQIINTKIIICGNYNRVYIGKNCHYIGNSLICLPNYYNNRIVNLGNNAMIMGADIYCEENANYIDIGNNLTCSDGVLIQNSDGHVIYDSDNRVLNYASKGIKIDENVWLGRKCSVLKNVHIKKGCIIGASCTLAKSTTEEGCVYVGNPAIIKRNNVKWTRTMFRDFKNFVGDLNEK